MASYSSGRTPRASSRGFERLLRLRLPPGVFAKAHVAGGMYEEEAIHTSSLESHWTALAEMGAKTARQEGGGGAAI